MLNNCIKNLLNLKELIIKKVKNCVEIYAELPISKQVCPCCGCSTSKIHDHYIQPIKDIPIQFKPTTVFLKKNRYECKNCGKSFSPHCDIIAKYNRKSKRLVAFTIEQLRNNISASTIAKNLNIDAGFISKMLPYLSVSNSTLPRVLCIDEFKGNSGKYKYQVALLDGETHKIFDILECRHKHFLCDYFKKFPTEQLNNVKFFVTDLWEPYKDIGMTYFRKAKIVADHFHWIRLDIVHSKNSSDIKKEQFIEWVKRNLESPVSQLVECAKTYQHWAYKIKNSLEVPYSNGPIEGTNNKIKTLKRTTFGMSNFRNFKARIMLLN